MLEIFIVLNEKDREKYQGEGRTMSAKARRGVRGKKHTYFFFLRKRKASKCLGCLPIIACVRSLA